MIVRVPANLHIIADISFLWFFFSVDCFNQLIELNLFTLVRSWRSVLPWFGNTPLIGLLRAKLFNPLSPKSDQHQISLCNINAL